MEPIQDDIEIVRDTLKYRDDVTDALAALDRLVAERDRLIQALERIIEEAIPGPNHGGCMCCGAADPDERSHADYCVTLIAREALTKEEIG